MGFTADAVDAGTGQGRRGEQLLGRSDAPRPHGDGRPGHPPASNQVQYSLLHRQPETNGVLDACRDLGVTLIAYQPLAGGALTGKYLHGDRPRGLRPLMPNFRGKARAHPRRGTPTRSEPTTSSPPPR